MPHSDTIAPTAQSQENLQDSSLVGWVMSKVKDWEDHRESKYDEAWDEYTRIWKGVWAAKDKTRDSERSRLISPATQQAVESTVSELEEATFGKGLWFDISDDIQDEEKGDMMQFRDLLREDLEFAKVPSEVARVFLNGALYGTGIAKIIVKEETSIIPKQGRDEYTGVTYPTTEEKEVVVVGLEAINPREFVIDPTARSIETALGCAHIIIKPKHTILDKQQNGVYRDVDLGSFPGTEKLQSELDTMGSVSQDDRCKIVEYFGKVPAALLEEDAEEDEISAAIKDLNQTGDSKPLTETTDFVEAMVTIANDGTLLKAVKNPYLMKDRPIIAYQHDTVNDSFWGRGVVEKGYNPQKALDAELRARIDALALTTHPMVAMDATRLPRGHKPSVRPGKIWLTNGNPSDAIMPFNLGGVNPSTFHQSGDLERMVQMGPGAMDSAAPISQNSRNQTASGMSMMNSQFIKRSKRSMQNIDRQFLTPLIQKSMWRYMQFNPRKYPSADFKFKVIASMGIMAREYEQGQLTQLLSIVPPDSPVFHTLIEGIFENSSLTNKSELLAALQEAKKATKEDQQQQQMAQMSMQLQMQTMQMELEKIKSETTKNYADAQAKTSKAEVDKINAKVGAFTAVNNAVSQQQNGANNEGTT